eukprot:gene8902-9820_t
MSSLGIKTTSPRQARLHKPRIIFVLGGPGAGKGTQCEKLAKEFSLTHLSAGELLRQEQRSGSENGQLIDRYLREGRIVPVEISLNLLKREILSTGYARYLIDGFPRNEDNLQGWLSHMPTVCDIEAILFIDCPEEELAKRILTRGLTSNRSDDNANVVQKRFNTFHSDTMPVIRHFQSMPGHYAFQAIPGEQHIDEVYANFRKAFLPYLLQDLDDLHGHLLSCIADGREKDYQEHCLKDSKGYAHEEEIINTLLKQGDDVTQLVISAPEVKDFTSTAAKQVYRLYHSSDKSQVLQVERHWQLVNGGWKLVSAHSHKL